MNPASSPALRSIDTTALKQRLDALRRQEVEAQAPDEALAPMLTAAATLAAFDPSDLLMTHGLTADAAMLRRLFQHSEPTRSDAGDAGSSVLPPGPWRLPLADRRRIARQTGAAGLRAARQQVRGPRTTTQRMADLLLAGTLPDLATLQPAELAALIEVRPWYEGVVRPVPDEYTLRARMAMTQVVEPLRRLVGYHFVGREPELARLEDYVALLGPRKLAGSALLGKGLRALRQVRRTLIDDPPLYVAGPGGVGKSSLIARFILNHLDAPEARAMPFVMLDFDRAQLEPRMPLSLLVAALHQLRAQFPKHDAEMQRMAEHLAQQMRSTDAVALEGIVSLQDTLVVDFARQVESMIGSESDAPLLWVLDTFEEPQRLGESTVGPLWELMDTLQQALPRLRLVVCGRVVPSGFRWDEVRLDGFDEASAIAFLRHRLEADPSAPSIDDRRLAQVVKVVGRTPLALRLAARLIAREDPQLLNLRLRRENVQAVLFHRVLEHLRVDARLEGPSDVIVVDGPERVRLEGELARLVFPGLAVRRLTPGVIEHVLGQPCGVKLRDEHHVERLFRALAQQVDIVEPGDDDGTGRSLMHRTDVRRMMLRDLEQKAGEDVVRRIDRAAVAYHAAIPSLANCAEEIYHRLRLEQSEGTIRARWEPGLEPYLLNALDEIVAPAMRELLADLLGVTLDAAQLEGARQDAWERQAARRAGEYLRAGNPERALQVLNEREPRSHASPLWRLQAQALLQLGGFEDAAALADRALDEAAEAGELAAAAEAALLLAQALEALGDFDAAEQRVRQALDWVQESPDRLLRLRAAAARIRLARKRGAPEPVLDEMARQIAPLLTGEMRRALRSRPAVLRELLAELGKRDQRLLLLGVDVLGVDLTSPDDARAIGAALDAAAQGPERETPALDIALAHGVIAPDRPPPIGHRAWSDWLWNASPREAGDLVRDMLKLPPADEALIAALAALFRREVDRRIGRGSRARAV
jgi:cellulose synthase operon protein C